MSRGCPDKVWVYDASRVHDGHILTFTARSHTTAAYLESVGRLDLGNPAGESTPCRSPSSNRALEYNGPRRPQESTTVFTLTTVRMASSIPYIWIPDGQHLREGLIAMIGASLQFVTSGPGALTTIALSVVGCMLLATLAWRSRRADVQALMITAGMLTLLTVASFVEGTRLRWWGGAFVHELPLVVQVAILIPAGLLGWLVWMGGYCWLASRVSYPQLVYLAVAVLAVIAAALADRAELSQGLIDVGDGNVWFNALIFVLVMFVPIVLYDVIKHTLQREMLP